MGCVSQARISLLFMDVRRRTTGVEVSEGAMDMSSVAYILCLAFSALVGGAIQTRSWGTAAFAAIQALHWAALSIKREKVI
jgi:hypothetical protein